MHYLVNVEVALRRADRWLLIVRGAEGHAAGALSLIGGKCEMTAPTPDALEVTARREVAEEVGVDLTGQPLTYVESVFFLSDSGEPVVNVVFAADAPDDAEPVIASPAEVADLQWRTLAEIEADLDCPAWTRQSLRRAAQLVRLPW